MSKVLSSCGSGKIGRDGLAFIFQTTVRQSAAEAKDKTDYKEQLLNAADQPAHHQQSNSRQVKYFQSARSHKIKRDKLVNLQEVAFIWSITTYPDLIVCLESTQLMDINCTQSEACLSYDTTENAPPSLRYLWAGSYRCFSHKWRGLIYIVSSGLLFACEVHP